MPEAIISAKGTEAPTVRSGRFTETKTTIPISRTPKPISGFGLKPGRYRPSAVKVAGFDPLDANHAASTGVRPLPVLSLAGANPVWIRPDQGKEHNEQHPHR